MPCSGPTALGSPLCQGDFSSVRPWDCGLLKGRAPELSTRRGQGGCLLVDQKGQESKEFLQDCGLATWRAPEQLGLQSPVTTQSDGVSPLVPATNSSLGPRNGEGNAGPDVGAVPVTVGYGLLALISLEGE